MWQEHLRPCAVFTETSEGFAPYYLAGIRHDLSQTTIVVDVFSKNVHQDVVIDILEATLDVSFDEPFGPVPCVMDFCQGRLASLFRSETMAVVRKLWLIV